MGSCLDTAECMESCKDVMAAGCVLFRPGQLFPELFVLQRAFESSRGDACCSIGAKGHDSQCCIGDEMLDVTTPMSPLYILDTQHALEVITWMAPHQRASSGLCTPSVLVHLPPRFAG